MKIPLIVILGPTSVGKTKVAISLAKQISGEIISADSRQVYKEMNIGTDKPSLEEQEGIPHHLLDIINPDVPFTLAEYVQLAWEKIDEIHTRGKVPMLVGSAGLYIRALCEGYQLPIAPPNETLRHSLEERINREGTQGLYEELCHFDPEGGKVLDSQNPRRLIRFYEIYKATGELPSQVWKKRDPRVEDLNIMKFGLTRVRAKIYERIVERVGEQQERGLLEEVRGLLQKYPATLKAFQTHSYQEVFPYLKGEYSWEKAKELIVRHTFQYARRQMIWFKKEKRVHWFEAEPFLDWDSLATRLFTLYEKLRL